MRGWWLVGLAVLGTSGCGYRRCGTMKYWISVPDGRFDTDGDSYLDLEEGCGVDVGSFGSLFPDVGYVQLLFDPSQWDLADGVDITYDYLPITEIVFLASHLEVGEVMTMDALDGYGFHIHQGDSNAAPSQAPLVDGRIEVLAGPKEGPLDSVRYRLAWDLTIGEPSDAMPMGYQHLEGKDWIGLDDSLWAWDGPGHAYIEPPDAGD